MVTGTSVPLTGSDPTIQPAHLEGPTLGLVFENPTFPCVLAHQPVADIRSGLAVLWYRW